jgi:hypothetical protein
MGITNTTTRSGLCVVLPRKYIRLSTNTPTKDATKIHSPGVQWVAEWHKSSPHISVAPYPISRCFCVLLDITLENIHIIAMLTGTNYKYYTLLWACSYLAKEIL